MPEPTKPITISSWPSAILHMDADAFFAACEQAVKPYLKGKPVITGKERGIVAAASYEAKALGVKRGVSLSDAIKMCPGLVCLPSDYETYSLLSMRMFEILRRYSPVVEEYSMDEAFVDLSGMRRCHHCSYTEIARRVQATIERELDLSVSVGVSLTKVLAKVASKAQKPRGITIIPGKRIHLHLERMPIEDVWGIGRNTAIFLNKHGIHTALQFARADERFINRNLSKPFREVWHELRGEVVYQVDPAPKSTYQSIGKMKTFTPPSANEAFVFAQLVKNLEGACIKARRYKLVAPRFIVHLRTQDFQDEAVEVKLTRPSAFPAEIAPHLRPAFQQLYRPGRLYRATSVVLADLVVAVNMQRDLFEDGVGLERTTRVYDAVDYLSKRFGKHTVHLGASLPAKAQRQHEGERGDIAQRKQELVKGENYRQRLGLPMLVLEDFGVLA